MVLGISKVKTRRERTMQKMFAWYPIFDLLLRGVRLLGDHEARRASNVRTNIGAMPKELACLLRACSNRRLWNLHLLCWLSWHGQHQYQKNRLDKINHHTTEPLDV